MSLIEYINSLAAKGVELWVSDGKLQYKAPKEVMTPQVLSELKERKGAIIELLLALSQTTGVYPLSYSQKSLWSLHQLNPRSAAYNVTYAAKLVDGLDVNALSRCFDYLIARHPILRTRYCVVDDEPRQKVETAASARLQIEKLAIGNEGDVLNWIDREANQPFDLTASPVRMKLLVNEEAKTPSPLRYVLLINVHHIAADFWSLEILLRELSTLYRLAIQGEPLALPPIRLQYKDCVQHEIERLQGVEGTALASFWERELAGELPVLDLPTDHIRPPVKTEQGLVHTLDLGEPLTRAVKELAKAHQVTPYMLLLSVYQVFLFLHSGQNRILIGAPTAGRELAGSETVLGHFVNTVVLSCVLDPARRFSDLLADTRSLMLRVLEYQHYPFPLLVERLRPPRDPSRSPVYQVMYNWNQAHRGTREHLDGLLSSLVERMLVASSTGTRGATHDLTLNIYDYGDRYVTAWTFNTDLFRPETIEQFAGEYRVLLQQVLAEPLRCIGQYPLITPEKRTRILDQAAEQNSIVPAPGTITSQFVDWARVEPDRPAVILDARHLRYGDVLQAYLRTRAKLAELGVCAGVQVSVDVSKAAELAVVVLALLDLGADIRVVSRDEGWAERDSSIAPRLHVLGSPGDSPWDPDRIDIAQADTSFQLPAGWFLTAPQCEVSVRGMQRVLNLASASRVLSLSGSDWRLQLAELLGTLASGGRAYVQTQLSIAALASGDVRSAMALQTFVDGQGITALAVPELLAHCLENRKLASLSTLVLIGERNLPPHALAGASTEMRLLPHFNLQLCSRPLSFTWTGNAWTLDRTSVGAVTLLFGRLTDLADDEMPGRIALLLSSGEVRRTLPAAAELEWIPERPQELTEHELVRTSLLAKRMAASITTYQGSSSRIVSHRSAPFSLDAVEELINRESTVASAVCVLQEIGGQRTLVACIQLRGSSADRASECEARLRKQLKTALPEYMHPRTYVFLDSLPISSRGLLDESRLPVSAEQAQPSHVAPRNEVEEKLAALWREVLGLTQVGIHDNFFELGGDSILGAVIISKANLQGLYFSPKEIFENTTIAELAAVVKTAPDVVVDQGRVTGPAPLTPAQLWFFDHIGTDRSHFNQALLVQLSEVPDPEVMEKALRLLSQHHDVLQSRFEQHDGQWRQVFGPHDDARAPSMFSIVRCDSPPSARQPFVSHAIREAQSSLRIEPGELFKAVWLDCGSLEESRLLVIAHHLAIDGVSWSFLLEDLRSIYTQLSSTGEARLPLKTTSFKSWAEHLRDYAQTDAARQDIEFWTQLRNDAQKVRLGERGDSVLARASLAAADSGNLEADKLTSIVALDRDLTTAFQGAVHQAYNTDANDLLVAAIYKAFASWNGRSSLQIDVEGHGREPLFADMDISRTVGWFTSIYPVLLDTGENIVEESTLIKRIKQQLRSVPNRGIGYGMLRYLRDDPGCDLTSVPQSPILFTYLGRLDQLVSGGGLYAGKVEAAPDIRNPSQTRTHLFEICAYVLQGRLTIECVFSGRIFSHAAIETLLRNVRGELAALIAHCMDPSSGGLTPSDLPDIQMGQDELDELLAEVALLDR